MTLPTPSELAATIANRGDCAGPMTTFPAPGVTHVVIVCRRNWVEVIQWLDACEKSMPALVEIYRAALAYQAAMESDDLHDDGIAELDALYAALDRAKGTPSPGRFREAGAVSRGSPGE